MMQEEGHGQESQGEGAWGRRARKSSTRPASTFGKGCFVCACVCVFVRDRQEEGRVNIGCAAGGERGVATPMQADAAAAKQQWE